MASTTLKVPKLTHAKGKPYSPDQKKKAVGYFLQRREQDPEVPVNQVARELTVVDSLLRGWSLDQRYNPHAPPKVLKNGPRGLPTAAKISKMPRQLIPVTFQCPHCGGKVTMPHDGASA